MATASQVQTSTVNTLVMAEPSSATTMTDEDEPDQSPRSDDDTSTSHVGIRYTAACFDLDEARQFRISQDDKPLEIQISNAPEASSTTPVIELITGIGVRLKYRDFSESSEANAMRAVVKDLEDYRIENVQESTLVVHSPYLKKVIREVVTYYPSQNLIGETILIEEPFAVLAHHADQLANMQHSNDHAGITSLEIDTEQNHMSLFLDFMRSKVEPMYLPAKKRLQHATTPTVTFEDAWYLLKPGLKAYAEVNGVSLGCIIERVQYEEREMERGTPQRLAVEVWFLDVNRVENDVSPVRTIVYINRFGGERKVTSLSIYPREYHDRNDGDARKRQLEARGRKMRDIVWKGHKLLDHEGELVTRPISRVKDQMIVGAVDVYGIVFPDNDWIFEAPRTPSQPPSVPETDIREPLQYRLEPKKHGSEYLTQDLLFMLCPVHIAFVVSTKTWVLINVENTREIQDIGIPPEPILDPSSRKVIDALAGYQLKEEKPWSADFIRDKGEGVVIMLHGPPGVGKTYTVESLALRMKRPLITLTIAEIGIKEEQIQAQLKKWLTLAELWQAILLIDECDVFLERREAFDIARNGVVAAFLRNIEYFSGLLFLTTNRVGHIDEAFLSRVHAVIYFRPLNEANRKVLWKSLLDKLHRDRPDKIQMQMEAIEYLESDEMLKIDWNGREIRNAMQTAIALAEKDAQANPYHKEGNPVSVSKSHFEAVQRLNKSFKVFLTSIRDETQVERARNYYKRNDEFSET